MNNVFRVMKRVGNYSIKRRIMQNELEIKQVLDTAILRRLPQRTEYIKSKSRS